jgi:hypothetical protein
LLDSITEDLDNKREIEKQKIQDIETIHILAFIISHMHNKNFVTYESIEKGFKITEEDVLQIIDLEKQQQLQ